MKCIITILFFLFLTKSVFSQIETNKDLLSVSINIVGKGVPDYCKTKNKTSFYFATVCITNQQDTAINFAVSDCPWTSEIFLTNLDSVAFIPCNSGCDNFEAPLIVLPYKKSVYFNVTIKSFKKDLSLIKFKVGFRLFPTSRDIWLTNTNSELKKFKIYWSNEVELKDNLYSYEIK